MATEFQLVIDSADPAGQVRFWTATLHYVVEPAPSGFATWNDYWRSIGIPEDELDQTGDGSDSIIDPDGAGPRIWFQPVPEPKTVKNRLHIDVKVGGGRTVPLEARKERVQAEADRLIALGATVFRVLEEEGVDHFAIVMGDPEGNEFCVV
jgi:hypothetical protein